MSGDECDRDWEVIDDSYDHQYVGGRIMSWEQCLECGRNAPRDELIETCFDDDGMGGIVAEYVCPDCWNAEQMNDFYLEQFNERE